MNHRKFPHMLLRKSFVHHFMLWSLKANVSVAVWAVAVWAVAFWGGAVWADDTAMKPIPIQSAISSVQPMTGIVLWTTNESVATAPIQLEYSYFTYSQVVTQSGQYDWSGLERMLDQVAKRGHQAIIRFHDTYVGKKTGVPKYITELSGYETTKGKSEKKATEFPDWSHPELRRFTLEFFDRFAARYDRDPRIAFIQVGFGLWAEYHIYDGPMILGKTFPTKEYQAEFVEHLSKTLVQTPWMISVDGADDAWAPFAGNEKLLKLPFGLFDDSFNHKTHSKENEPNWVEFGMDRWKRAPTGGEFSFFEKVDQSKALSETGPHGIPFEKQAGKFHISFMIGDAQPQHQKRERISSASQACGYRFRVTGFEANSIQSRVEIENTGIAPLYHDAFATVNGTRSKTSLKGLLPGERKWMAIDSGASASTLSIESDRLVSGQRIEFEANLP